MPELQGNHPNEDELLELSLGSLSSGAEEATVLAHVNSCLTCRASYDEISRTLDATLPASPAAAPPAGFEARVLDRVGIGESPRQPAPRRTHLLVAAAAVAGLVIGGTAVAAVQSSDSPPATTASSDAEPLRTASGAAVGDVLQSNYDGQSVLIMHIQDGPPGMHYTCRLRLADGSARTTGEWTVPDSGKAVWIVSNSAGAASVELVTDSGKVWSTASVED